MESLRDSQNRSEHVIDITGNCGDSSCTAPHDRHSSDGMETAHHESRPTAASVPTIISTVNGSNRADRRRPLSFSVLWMIPIEFIITMSQIVAAIVVLSLSKKREDPHAHESILLEWHVGYASGCVATLPILYWRYCHRNQNPELNFPAVPFSLSLRYTSEFILTDYPRVKVLLMELLKMSVDSLFVVLFPSGNYIVFSGHVSTSEAPNLYRLLLMFLAINYISYSMHIYIMCNTLLLLWRSEISSIRGVTAKSINSLPTYKFKIKKNKNGDDAIEGGVVERLISGENAVCCICLAKYANNDELRELPCYHLLHKECVDKWLKINASCPLCNTKVNDIASSVNKNRTSSRRGSRFEFFG